MRDYQGNQAEMRVKTPYSPDVADDVVRRVVDLHRGMAENLRGSEGLVEDAELEESETLIEGE